MRKSLLVLLAACSAAPVRHVATPPPPPAKHAYGPAERSAYARGLAEGRKLTVEKDYAGAVAAFTCALGAIPGDGRALAERGYARLLAQDLDLAMDDFASSLAAIAADDKELRAQVEFNIGLVYEQRGFKNDASARKLAAIHFLRSHELHATEAAREHIAESNCPVAAITPTITTYASFDEAVAKIRAQFPDVSFDDRGELDVHARLVEVNKHGRVLLPLEAGRVARVDVGMTGTWNCGVLGEVVVSRRFDVYRVVYQAHRGGMSPGLCACDDGVVCSGRDETSELPKCKCDAPVCPLVCGGADEPEGWHIESYVDAKTGTGLFQVELDHDQLAKVKLDVDVAARRFGVSGPSCRP